MKNFSIVAGTRFLPCLSLVPNMMVQGYICAQSLNSVISEHFTRQSVWGSSLSLYSQSLFSVPQALYGTRTLIVNQNTEKCKFHVKCQETLFLQPKELWNCLKTHFCLQILNLFLLTGITFFQTPISDGLLSVTQLSVQMLPFQVPEYQSVISPMSCQPISCFYFHHSHQYHLVFLYLLIVFLPPTI